MRLAADTALFALKGVPMVGNFATGGIIGLTSDGARLCQALTERDISLSEVPEGSLGLVQHLQSGGYLAEAPSPQPSLSSAYLHVTQRCNLACRHCYSAGNDRNSLPDPSLSQLDHAIKVLAALGCTRLVISGGEPFLRNDLANISVLARDAGIATVIILTNGLLITDETANALANKVSCIAVSFDGTSADSCAYLRGASHFEPLVAAIRRIRDMGIEARIIPTLHARNLADITAYQQLASELGVMLSFSLLTGDICSLGDLALTNTQLHRLGVSCAALGLPGNDSFESKPPLSARRSCGAGSHTLSIAADGTVYPCHMLHRRELAMGNAFLDTPKSILSSAIAHIFQSLDVNMLNRCSSCEFRHLCGGGCRARAYLTSGILTDDDPYCELSYSYYEAVSVRLAKKYGSSEGGSNVVRN